jgi:hypothetical protein
VHTSGRHASAAAQIPMMMINMILIPVIKNIKRNQPFTIA